jgi:hypothetical protein
VFRKLALGFGLVVGVLYLIGTLSGPSSHTVTGLLVPRDSRVVAAGNPPDLTIVDVLNAPRNFALPEFPPPSDYTAFCTEQWTKRGVTDEHMKNYCVGKERDGYAEIQAILGRYKGYFWLGGVLTAAEEKWTKHGIRQDSMVAYELKQQIDAFLDLQYMLQQGRFNVTTGTVCLNKWTKGASPDWNMTEYCYKQQIGRE